MRVDAQVTAHRNPRHAHARLAGRHADPAFTDVTGRIQPQVTTEHAAATIYLQVVVGQVAVVDAQIGKTGILERQARAQRIPQRGKVFTGLQVQAQVAAPDVRCCQVVVGGDVELLHHYFQCGQQLAFGIGGESTICTRQAFDAVAHHLGDHRHFGHAELAAVRHLAIHHLQVRGNTACPIQGQPGRFGDQRSQPA